MVDEKYIGLFLAVTSSFAIGISFVITKLGLQQAERQHGFQGEGFVYLLNPVWWAGILTMVVGEVCNFAAYAFAPAILVTPLGALSVLVGSILGSYVLHEELGVLGKLGSAICLLGAVIIVIHAPADEEIERVDQILDYALKPGFLAYSLFVLVFATVMIYKVAPVYGKKNALVYLSICSLVGSISVMSVKAFGIALKLTFSGHNQFFYISTYLFMILTALCILIQMNYFNKALSQFPTNIVNPLYYVTFTTATLCASTILFSGFNTTDPVGTFSLLCGFLVTFAGVYLLNLSRMDPSGRKFVPGHETADVSGTDMVSSFQTRLSISSRHSMEGGMGRRSGVSGSDRRGLIHSYEDEEAAVLAGLTDDSDSEGGDVSGGHDYSHQKGSSTKHHKNGGSSSVYTAVPPQSSTFAVRTGDTLSSARRGEGASIELQERKALQ